MMLRKEYPELLEGEDRERAKRLAEVVVESAELLLEYSERGALQYRGFIQAS